MENKDDDFKDESFDYGQCGTCVYSAGLIYSEVNEIKESGEEVLLDFCMRYPPVFVGAIPGKAGSWQYPIVRCTDGCGEWRSND